MFIARKFRRKTVFLFILLATFSLILYGSALAAETASTGGHGSDQQGTEQGAVEGGEGAGHGADRSADLKDLLYRFMNFAVLVIVLIWAIKKAGVKQLIAARIEDIKQKMADLKKGKETSESQYREIEKKLEAFEAERKEIIEQYKKEGLAEKEKIIAEAKERVKQIIEQAEFTIQQEIQSAKDRLKQEVVDLAAQKAQEIIAQEMTESDQDLLVNDFIERVGKLH